MNPSARESAEKRWPLITASGGYEWKRAQRLATLRQVAAWLRERHDAPDLADFLLADIRALEEASS